MSGERAAAPATRGDRRPGRTRAFAALAALAAALPYLAGGGLRTFVPLDDPQMVVENPRVLQGLSLDGVRWAFTTTEWGNWHPLALLSHMADVQLFGLWAWGHHLTSVLLHAATAALLFLALRRLTGAATPSLVAASLFGAHPLRVESVAWVAERKDVLAGLFFALVLLAWEGYARRGGRRRYALVAVLLALGLMAKPTLVTLPPLLALLDVWPLGRWHPGDRWRRLGLLLAEKLPLFALSLASSLAVYLTQRAAGAMSTEGPGLGVRLANATISYGTYLARSFWPASLAPYYPYPQAIAWGTFVLSAATLAATCALAWASRRRWPWLGTGWLWFLGMLVPMIGVVQVGGQALADRATYLPAIGLAVAAAWGAAASLRRRAWRRPGALAAAAVTTALAAASAHQVGYWRDGETILRRTLAVTTGNWLAHNNLGALLGIEGRHGEAIAQFEASLRIAPAAPDTRHNLAKAHVQAADAALAAGRAREALEHLRAANGLVPGDPEILELLEAARRAAGGG